MNSDRLTRAKQVLRITYELKSKQVTALRAFLEEVTALCAFLEENTLFPFFQPGLESV